MTDRLPIPLAVFDQHIILLGKTRSGKSSKMRVMIEAALDRQVPVCIIDPKGDWWGLKSAADGKKAGYPVVIFGGAHGDIPINAQSGKAVAELVATGNRPCIIDLKGWTIADRTRFFIGFAETFFAKAKGRRILAIDEVHNFAPQTSGRVDPQTSMMLHWANRLASEGSGLGITLMSASQRPQKVHKDYVSSHETLIACRVIHKRDREAYEDWIEACGDDKSGDEVLMTVANMERKEAWVWAPEIHFGPKRIIWPLFKTYDSFKPQAAKSRRLKGWAAVDLDEVRDKLAIAIEENKAKDPIELRKQIIEKDRKIADLEKQAAAKTPAAPAKPDKDAIAAAEKKGFDQAEKKLRGAMDRALRKQLKETLGMLRGYARKFVEQIDGELEAVNIREAKAEAVTFTPPPAAPVQQPRPTVQQKPTLVPRPAPTSRVTEGDGEDRPLTAERKPLAALASVYPSGMTEAQWAVASVLKRTGGTWSTYVSRLRMAGRIVEENGLFYVSEKGLADLGGEVAPMPAPGPALVQFWAGKITAVGPMLNRLAEIYPTWTTREQLAADLNLAVGGGTFSTYLSRLRSPGLIEEDRDGALRAAPQLIEQPA